MTSSQQNSLKEKLNSILNSDSIVEQKSFFSFDNSNTAEQICFKFNIWSRKLFPKYYKSKDAPFHHDMDLNLVRLYLGDIKEFVNAAFKGASKTSKAKLFIAFAIANDLDHRRRYFRILAADKVNSTQIATDIYNMLVSPSVTKMYPEIFAKTVAKREETMGSFTTSTGIKVFSGTVGMSQRGAIQEDARPDFIWYEDFENRTTLRSAKKTKAIWDNMEEARTGLAKGGVGYYTTSDADEIAYIDAACKSPIVQMERVAALDDGKISKPADPAIAQAAEDAAKNTALEANPEVAALRDKLSNVIATNKGK